MKPPRPVGSICVNDEGYALIKVSDAPHRWMLAHRWAMEKKLGRKLKSVEHVHHACRDQGCPQGRACFDDSHLEVKSQSAHMSLHTRGRTLSPDHVEAIRGGLRRWWATPGRKKSFGKHMAALWRDPEYRARQIASRKEAWKKRVAKPGYVHNCVGLKHPKKSIRQRSEALSRYWLEHRDRAASLARKRWADPELRAKMIASQRARRARERAAG